MSSRCFSVAIIVFIVTATVAMATGEPVNGFPRWEERVMLELMNRARVAPATDLSGCGANCSAAELASSCYTPIAPLTWTYGLNKSSRFHSASMGLNSFFGHPTSFVLRSDIDSVYPASCNGSSACASLGAGTTDPFLRISYFGVSGSSEIIAAGYATPYDAHYSGWLFENGAGAGCTPTSTNGHRYEILKGGPGVGTGYFTGAGPYTRYYTGDFGTGGAIPKIASGTHWGALGSSAPNQRQSSTIEFWANWYDAAGPLSATVVVDGVSHAMSMSRGSSTNGAWTVSLGGLASGCHRYYFLFMDSTSVAVRYPTTGTLGIGDDTCADWSGNAPARRGDFNADGTADLMWRGSLDGVALQWFMNGTTVTGVNNFGPVSTSTQIEGVADLNGDGHADLVWRNPTNGDVNIWLMNSAGTGVQSAVYVGSVNTDYKIEGVGDFNGDGKDDIVWRGQTSGGVIVWIMNGATVQSVLSLGSVVNTYHIEGFGDLNADGKADIVWRGQSDGAVIVWLTNAAGNAVGSSTFVTNVNTTYKIVSASDMTGDGRADIVWRGQTDGNLVVWVMNGATVTSVSVVANVTTTYNIEAVADLNGDGISDIVWRGQADGNVVAWIISPTLTVQQSALVSVVNTTYQIVGPK